MSTKYYTAEPMVDDEVAVMLPVGNNSKMTSSLYTHKSPWLRIIFFLNGLIICGALVTFVISLHSRMHNTRTICATRLSTFSPAYEAIEYSTVTFDGTFRSIYRGTPTPELDAAWDRITLPAVQPLAIPRETLVKIGKVDKPSLVRYLEEDGGGYMASLEIVHQLHCLNMLRKYTYVNEYYKDSDIAFTVDPGIFRTHLDHCVDLLRQNLMCIADIGVITYEWVEGSELPYPNFSTVHQCRNFEKVLDWAYNHAVHVPRENVTRLAFDHEVDSIVPP